MYLIDKAFYSVEAYMYFRFLLFFNTVLFFMYEDFDHICGRVKLVYCVTLVRLQSGYSHDVLYIQCQCTLRIEESEISYVCVDGWMDIFSVNIKTTFYILIPFLNLNCSGTHRLFTCKSKLTLLSINFSTILVNVVSNELGL